MWLGTTVLDRAALSQRNKMQKNYGPYSGKHEVLIFILPKCIQELLKVGLRKGGTSVYACMYVCMYL